MQKDLKKTRLHKPFELTHDLELSKCLHTILKQTIKQCVLQNISMLFQN